MCVCVCVCTEWAHRTTQGDEFSVSCDSEITGEEERTDVSVLFSVIFRALLRYSVACCADVYTQLITIQSRGICTST